MKHTELYKEYKKLDELERQELIAAVKAHGGEYIFIEKDDENWDDNDDVPIVCACFSYSDGMSDYYVSRVIVDDKGYLSIYGFDKEYDSPFDERKLYQIETGHIGTIIDFIPTTETVEDVSTNAHKYKVYAAFGRDLTEAIAKQKTSIIDAGIACPDSFRLREFDTQAEADAYVKGLDDACGWMESVALNPQNPFENEIIEKINNR